MGECADMMLDGTCCQCCGEFLGTDNGYPTYCSDCAPKPEVTTTTKDGYPIDRPNKINCPECNKLVKKAGLNDHIKAVHTEQTP